MSKHGPLQKSVIGVLLLAMGGDVEAGAGNRSPESDLAAPGAALYEYAVTESVRGLMSKEEQAAARPPSPGPEYYWCEQCKAYHRRQAPASAQQPAVASIPGNAPSRPNAATDVRPPSPGPQYYWCEKCKSYHLRQAATNQPVAAAQASPGTLAPRTAPASGSGVGTRPPSPGPQYYWCEQCKAYHLRQRTAQLPGTSPVAPQPHTAPPATGTMGGQVPSGDYYYCETCKTYHRRQPIPQQPTVEVNRSGGGVSNSLSRSPILGPAGKEH